MANVIQRESVLERDYRTARRRMLKKVAIPLALIVVGILGFVGSGVISGFLSPAANMAIGKYVPLFWVLIPIGGISYIVVGAVNKKDMQLSSSMVKSGVVGERKTLQIMASLPDGVTVIPDVSVHTSSGTSQLDFVVITNHKIYVVENKNLNGTITGRFGDQNWKQDKVGRGGTPYGKTFYSPVKQVGTHVFRLKEYLKEHGVRNVPWIQSVVFFSNDEASVFIEDHDFEKCPILQGRQALLDFFFHESQQAQTAMDTDLVAHLISTLSQTA